MDIKTTGIEQYMPGGTARLQLMIIGGPGVGKTRWASYWPKPIYANIEAGLSSVADRTVPYADITTSEDMLTFLKGLKRECSKPTKDRRWHTVVIDTLDAYQRKVKDEYLQKHPNMEAFRGFDAWGYLDTRMQMLMTRLLNLDMNVIVLVHYKDKTITEGTGENKIERHELMLQLQGDIKDSAFNDFDLVGWMGTYWAVNDDNERVQRRGITFTADPERPFLKDRLHITPPWLPVEFAETDYSNLFALYAERIDDFDEGGKIDEISDQDEAAVHEPAPKGVAPPDLAGGPLPPQEQRGPILSDMKRTELLAMARELGIEEATTSTLKADLVEMIERKRDQTLHAEAEQVKRDRQAEAGDETPDQESEQTHVQSEEVAEPEPEKPEPEPEPEPEQPKVVETEDGDTVDIETGEVLTPEQIAEQLGATIVEQPDEPEPKPVQRSAAGVCEVDGCDRDLAGENPDYVKLSKIKFKKRMCNDHYLKAKAAA